MTEMREKTVSADSLAAIREQADAWFLRVQEGSLSEAGLADWHNWLAQDPRHRAAFEEVEALWRQLDQMPPPPLPSPEALAADTYDGSRSVTDHLANPAAAPVDRSGTQSRPRRHFWPVAGWETATGWIAAGAVLSLMLIVLLFPPFQSGELPPVDTYQTGIGEHRDIPLPDGSRLELAAKSIVTLAYSERERRLHLISGEAYFQVARDPQRPFRVDAGRSEVEAVGTAFNVNHTSRGIQVTVTEGVVKVSGQRPNQPPQRLNAGQRVQIAADGTVGAAREANTDAMLSWREGLLVFIDEPLADVVLQLNRYSRRQIVLASETLKRRPYTGTVDKDRIEEWLQGIGRAYGMRVSWISDDTVLLFDEDA